MLAAVLFIGDIVDGVFHFFLNNRMIIAKQAGQREGNHFASGQTWQYEWIMHNGRDD